MKIDKKAVKKAWDKGDKDMRSGKYDNPYYVGTDLYQAYMLGFFRQPIELLKKDYSDEI